MKKKKLLNFAALAISSFGLMTIVNAEPVTCDDNALIQVKELCYNDLQEAVKSAISGDTVYIRKTFDISNALNSNITISSGITLDLGTNELTFSGTSSYGLFITNAGDVTIKNGKISQNIPEGSPTALFISGPSNVTLEDVEITSTKYNAIVINSASAVNLKVEKSATIKCTEGQAISATSTNEAGIINIDVSGKLEAGKKYTAINAAYNAVAPVNVTINKDAEVIGGALQMSKGKLSIAGIVTSSVNSAVDITRGELEILDGAVIKSTAVVEKEWTPSASGEVTDDGSAIFIEPKDNVKVTINGGEITSTNSYGISAPDGSNNGKLTINIEKGTIESAKGGINLVNFDKQPIIKAGTIFTIKGQPDDSVLEYTDNLSISQDGVVGKVNTIIKGAVSKGVIDVVEDAAEGETVVVKVTAYAGYEVSNVTVKGTSNVTVTKNADGTYSFTMPGEQVTVSAEFVEKTPSKPAEDKNDVVVETPKGDENVTLSTEADEVLKDTLLNTEDEELKELLESNENVTIVLENEKITKEDMPKEELEKFEKAVEGATVTEFFELDIVVKVDGKDNHYLTELNKPITLTIDLPELPEVAKGYARKYYILREHEGVVEKLDATLTEDGKLSFATDKFSKYAIAYVDEEVKDSVADKNPSTIDNVMAYVSMAIASIGALGITSKKFLKR